MLNIQQWHGKLNTAGCNTDVICARNHGTYREATDSERIKSYLAVVCTSAGCTSYSMLLVNGDYGMSREQTGHFNTRSVTD
jgi:hypothetical protein